MKKIVLLDRGTLPGIQFDFNFSHVWEEYDNCPHNDVSQAIHEAEVIITNKVRITREVMLENPQLKLIAVAATGYNNVDIEAAKTLGIRVCNVAGYSTDSVAEHAFMMILALVRSLTTCQIKMKDDAWAQSPYFYVSGFPIQDLKGKILGIIGKGSIGQALADRAFAFGMKILFAEHRGANNIRPGYTAFSSVLEQADVLSLHCPLTPDTKDLIGDEEFYQMKPNAVLINVSRGGTVNESALAEALKQRLIFGAACDVLSSEPPPTDHPLLNKTLPNFILTPHIAWTGDNALVNLTKILTENINAFVSGHPINIVV